MTSLQHRALITCLCLCFATACSDDGGGDEDAQTSDESTGDGDGDDASGDGDGDDASGDGDGDDTSGDGDGDDTSGDGDGDSTSGDGDGDGNTSGDGDGDTSGDGDGDTSGDGDGDGDTGGEGCGPDIVGNCPPVEGDAFQLLSAAIEGDCLTLQVEYSGGCADHSYVPCWGEFFLESDPVQANLTVIHDGMDDPCDGILQDSWTIDLDVIKQAYQDAYQQQNGTVIINVEGDSVQYDF